MRRTNRLAAAATVVAMLASAPPALATLTNAGFESGLTGWSSLGDVSTAPFNSVTDFNGHVWTVNASGALMAELNSNGATASGIESTLALPVGTLTAHDSSGATVTDGGLIYQRFVAGPGDTISEWWDYVPRDLTPYNDPAFAVLIDPGNNATITALAGITGGTVATGPGGNSGWHQFTDHLGAGAPTGNYTLAFITTNDNDTSLDSALFLDNAPGSCTPECPANSGLGTPEPDSLFILGLGLAGLGVFRQIRRKR